ncbi:MAG: Eco57I restriction-modification methylase domain-containing protein [Actinomycetota bacterium]|nr:Eco57I restriction-modification methylase domain-containing protein [Actinomycetota bacterium]
MKAAEVPYVAEHGVVYTRPWVADLVLDLAGYVPEANLVDAIAVEPSCGNGGFLESMIRRLSSSCRRQKRSLRDCESSIMAFDLSPSAVSASRERAESVLVACGWDVGTSQEIARTWIRDADFLLDADLDMLGLGGGVDFVVGNPPYVRLESIDQTVAEVYRRRYRTMIGRADLYVGFFERALEMLTPGGLCAFICADRWMLNQYGSRLRKLITSGGFSVEAVVEMHRADAFQDEVLAYPAITTIRRTDKQGKVLVARIDRNSDLVDALPEAARRVRSPESCDDSSLVAPKATHVVIDKWFTGSDPWPCVSPERLALLKRLEAEFPPLEDPATATKVGIGVATGADKVFLTEDPELVEESRLLPLALAKDTMSGVLEWSGHYLVNPWEADGSLVDLELYPRLRRYFEDHETLLRGRHVGRKKPSHWYKTIDKVNHSLTGRPKLLIPDIKSSAHPVYDKGEYYPHHNLYHVTSEGWDLRVLGGLLLSEVGQFFVECYAVRMSGGYLRFQAQYLRRIRVPRLKQLDPSLEKELIRAFEARDVRAATRAALRAYGIGEVPG